MGGWRSFASLLAGGRLRRPGIPCPLDLFFLGTTDHIQIVANVLGVGFWDFPGVKVGGQIDDATGKRGRKVVFLGVHENLQLSAYLVIVYFSAQLTHCGEQLVDAWLASCHGQPESNQELCGQAKATGEMKRIMVPGSAPLGTPGRIRCGRAPSADSWEIGTAVSEAPWTDLTVWGQRPDAMDCA